MKFVFLLICSGLCVYSCGPELQQCSHPDGLGVVAISQTPVFLSFNWFCFCTLTFYWYSSAGKYCLGKSNNMMVWTFEIRLTMERFLDGIRIIAKYLRNIELSPRNTFHSNRRERQLPCICTVHVLCPWSSSLGGYFQCLYVVVWRKPAFSVMALSWLGEVCWNSEGYSVLLKVYWLN